MKNLNELSVLELNSQDQTVTFGGDLGATVAAGLIIAAAVEIMGDWEHFKDGLFGRAQNLYTIKVK
ncbi:hypothetical protein ACJRPK_02470 [Aquimarina sp. 2-A2]|uniref:hypothetical protein n=1 Tax=Aquimarina sp. 2-A2 TaxID=3382644 RepID=UPI00387EFA65